MKSTESIHQLPSEIYQAELEEIAARRRAAGLPPLPEDAPRGSPSPSHGVVGLALSGGGIRSSTLSLGVVEALARGGVFKRVDYVSTVSGGGYTGSMLSAILNGPQAAEEPFPLEKHAGQEEPPSLRHLRNGSNYLSPGGLLDQLRLPLQILRGLLLNAMLVAPWIMVAVCITEIVYELGYRFWPELPVPPPVLAAIPLVALVLLSPLVLRYFYAALGWKGRNGYELMTSAALGVALLAVVLIPINYVISWTLETPWQEGNAMAHGEHVLKQTVDGRGAEVWIGVAVVLVLGVVLLRRPSHAVSNLVGKLAMYALGLVGPGVLFGLYLILCIVQIDSPFVDKRFAEELPPAVGASAEPFRPSAEFAEALAQRKVSLGAQNCVQKCVGAADDPPRWVLGPMSCNELVNKPQVNTCKSGGGVYVVVRWDRALEVEGVTTHLWDGMRDSLFYGIGLGLLLFSLLFMDVNLTSMHGFYRDRLSRLYLFKPVEGRIAPADALKLSALNAPGSAAPYHLLNATLNLQASASPDLRGRKSDFFFFSKRYCGGPHTGFCRTTDLERADSRIDLGTAMAISAAAASPNMGTIDLGSLRFLMTLLNVRLGYWAPNPQHLARTGIRRLLRLLGPGPLYLFREALGAIDDAGPYVNVSDGGHLENLGAYELLRRRCRVVIAVDGEADPALAFPGLMTLLRYAWIDLGVKVELDLSPLKPDASGASSQHVAIGSIDYGDGEKGTFVYVKSSVTGDEEATVADYRRANPAFPHESTADQFFNEHQFESYRALGEHIGTGLLQDDRFLALFRASETEQRPAAAVAKAGAQAA